MLPYIPDVVPNIVVALVIVVVFVMAFAPALRKCPVAFYAVWIAACMATFVDIVAGFRGCIMLCRLSRVVIRVWRFICS